MLQMRKEQSRDSVEFGVGDVFVRIVAGCE